MNNSINFNSTISNVNFTGFKWPRKVGFKEPSGPNIIKKNINNSEVEKKETAIRKSLEWVFKKLGFGKKLINAGIETDSKKEKAGISNQVHKDFILKRLIKKDSDNTTERIMCESLEDIERFFKDV